MQRTKFLLDEIIKLLKHGNFEAAYYFSEILEKEFFSLFNIEKENVINYAESLLNSLSYDQLDTRIYLISLLMEITKQEKYLDLIEEIILDENINILIKHFLYWQMRYRIFAYKEFSSRKRILHKSYKLIFNNFSNLIPKVVNWIPKNERDENLIIIFTNQFLRPPHAPTRTILDHCYILQKNLNKKVFIINVAEMPREIVVPFFKPFIANYLKNYSNINSINYKDEEFYFYQSDYLMPDVKEIYKLVNFVADNPPLFVYNMGGSCLTADMCSRFVPVVTISFSNELPVTEGQFRVVWEELQASDYDIILENGVKHESLIQAGFTYAELPVQKKKFERKDFNIPEEAFVLAIVGCRLDSEMSEDFVKWLVSFLQKDSRLYVLFAGYFETYDVIIKNYPSLQEKSLYLGFQDDILAVYDLCNAYLNPPRQGGGTSSVEALFKKLPVFTLPNGDVSYAVGKEFTYNSLDEIEIAVIKCIEDKDYYSLLSKKASERLKVVLDTEGMLKTIITEVTKRDKTF